MSPLSRGFVVGCKLFLVLSPSTEAQVVMTLHVFVIKDLHAAKRSANMNCSSFDDWVFLNFFFFFF